VLLGRRREHDSPVLSASYVYAPLWIARSTSVEVAPEKGGRQQSRMYIMTPTHVTFPPVNPAGCLAREHFRRDVERGAARCKHVVVPCPLAAEAEVHDLDSTAV